MALAVFGRIVVEQPSSRAIGRILKPGRAAAGHDHALARIDAFADGDLVDRLDHQLIGDGDDGESGFRHTAPELLRKLLEHAMRGLRIELHTTAVEVIRIEPAEHDARIGHGGLVAAGAVAGRAGHGAGALRADAQQAAGVDPGDRAAASADAAHVDRGHRHHVAQPAPA